MGTLCVLKDFVDVKLLLDKMARGFGGGGKLVSVRIPLVSASVSALASA